MIAKTTTISTRFNSSCSFASICRNELNRNALQKQNVIAIEQLNTSCSLRAITKKTIALTYLLPLRTNVAQKLSQTDIDPRRTPRNAIYLSSAPQQTEREQDSIVKLKSSKRLQRSRNNIEFCWLCVCTSLEFAARISVVHLAVKRATCNILYIFLRTTGTICCRWCHLSATIRHHRSTERVI